MNMRTDTFLNGYIVLAMESLHRLRLCEPLARILYLCAGADEFYDLICSGDFFG
jgi:hypothetical protein